jgi:hypothetical protein
VTDDNFGLSVDITADGTTIICGSSGATTAEERPGYVRVFKLVSDSDIGTNTWEKIGQDITGETNNDMFGNSVSISDDGKKIVIGAPNFDGVNGEDSGIARIYHLDDSGMSWEKIGDDIDGDSAGDELGYSVSLSANGTIAVIGAPEASVNEIRTGQVKVFRINSMNSSWEQLDESIYSDDVNARFGSSVDISSDGNTIAIGSAGDYRTPGYVQVFSLERSDNINIGEWKQIGQDITGEAVGDHFGTSVSLSDDGKTLAVSAPDNNGIEGDDSGHVRVYRRNGSEAGWMQLGNDIDGEEAYVNSGRSVSLSGTGDTVAISSPGYDGTDNGGRVMILWLNNVP